MRSVRHLQQRWHVRIPIGIPITSGLSFPCLGTRAEASLAPLAMNLSTHRRTRNGASTTSVGTFNLLNKSVL